jgi:hypothetical protein
LYSFKIAGQTRKEITGATARNYVKTIKLFCEMSDLLLPWKKFTRRLPKGRKYADDRASTIEEIYLSNHSMNFVTNL